MNSTSSQLAFQLRLVSLDSQFSVSEPPQSLQSSASGSCYEMDCSSFDMLPSSRAPSIGSTSSSSQFQPTSHHHQHSMHYHQYQHQPHQLNNGLVKGFRSTLSRSRCISDLSSLGSTSSISSRASQMHQGSSPNEGGWGYFVDSTMG